MASVQQSYGSNVSITITLDALANTTVYAGQQSTAISNLSSLYLDALVQLTIVSASSGVSTTGTVDVYAYGSTNGGTTYTDTVTGVDGAITLTSPPNVVKLGTINVVAVSTTYHSKLFSVAQAFGGTLPANWGIIVLNKSGAALGTGCSATYQGLSVQVV